MTILGAIVENTLRKHRALVVEARKLMRPRSDERLPIDYIVKSNGQKWRITAPERSHPMDIQHLIEVKIGKSFDQLGLLYLTPDNIEVAIDSA